VKKRGSIPRIEDGAEGLMLYALSEAVCAPVHSCVSYVWKQEHFIILKHLTDSFHNCRFNWFTYKMLQEVVWNKNETRTAFIIFNIIILQLNYIFKLWTLLNKFVKLYKFVCI
jgi:hypothetical protein